MKTLTMGSLFDGIGGFPLAAIHNGIVPVWASEIEAFPIEVTRLRFPDMVHVGDITKLDGAELPPVDIVVTMGCNVNCPHLPCRHREDWGLEDPTGRGDPAFRETIAAIHQRILSLRARLLGGELNMQ